jgi:hypothetical protein
MRDLPPPDDLIAAVNLAPWPDPTGLNARRQS